jgi:hypothetical protein
MGKVELEEYDLVLLIEGFGYMEVDKCPNGSCNPRKS